MSVTLSGSLTSAPLNYAIIKYPKGSVFVWLSDSQGSLDSLTAAMPDGTISQLIPDDAEAGNALGRRLSKALGKPVFIATSSTVGNMAVEAEIIDLINKAL